MVGLALITKAYNTYGYWGTAVFFIGHTLADASWYWFVSALVSKTCSFINIKLYSTIIIILGLVLLGFGLYFAWSGLHYVIG
jgi:hypothetical protein